MRIRAIGTAALASSLLVVTGCSGKSSGPDLFGGTDASTDSGTASDTGTTAADTPPPPRSALVIGIRTDLTTPDELDALHLEISQNGITQLENDFDIASHPLPTSLTICATDALCNNVVSGFLPPGKIVALDKSAPITITLVGLLGGHPITVRVARTTLVPNRVLALPLTIDAACVGQVSNQGKGVSSSCPADQSCIAGTCTTVDVDPSLLNDAP